MSNIMKGGQKNMEAYACYADSCCSTSQGRHFLTKEEKIEMLKEYKDRLDKESQGVTEKIASLENDE